MPTPHGSHGTGDSTASRTTTDGEFRPSDAASGSRIQLDLFLDGLDTRLVNQAIAGLVARDPVGAGRVLDRLRTERPGHPDLPALTRLARTLAPGWPAATQPALDGWIQEMETGLVAAARRLLGGDAETFLRPVWAGLASAATTLPRDEWTGRPLRRYWLGAARHHLGDYAEAQRLWLPLCWLAPALFADRAPASPSPTLREAWRTFATAPDFDDGTDAGVDPTPWFPAWLALREAGIARLFQPDDVPDTTAATRVFRRLLTLLPLEPGGHSDELVRQRSRLREVSPAFFRYYLGLVSARAGQPTRPPSSRR